jgi:hypothetical protein
MLCPDWICSDAGIGYRRSSYRAHSSVESAIRSSAESTAATSAVSAAAGAAATEAGTIVFSEHSRATDVRGLKPDVRHDEAWMMSGAILPHTHARHDGYAACADCLSSAQRHVSPASIIRPT